MTENKEIITGNDFKRMIAGAYSLFLLEHERINELNVFPVPDGDTGTNMLRTLGAVAGAIAKTRDEGIGALAKRAADSAIMAARGNSGVILSQIFRGLSRGLSGKWEADSAALGKAFQYGVLYAYRSVSKPVEGTILTVAKGIAKGTRGAVRENLPISDILEAAVWAGSEALSRTPEQLPALKSAGVVDAGGKGLIVFLQGCLQGLGGNFVATDVTFEMRYQSSKIMPQVEFEIARPYCTEFIIKRAKVKVSEVRSVLGRLGDSLIVAEGAEAIKVHIHTGHPGAVLEQAMGWGTLHDIKIDNMADQHLSTLLTHTGEKAKLKTAIISVAAGSGLEKIMKEFGSVIVIPGGQSMNPSVEEFIDAMHQETAEGYLILPNNRNIILAAEQVKKLLSDRIEIVPTANTPEGMAALVAYDPAATLEENAARMVKAARTVKEAAITRAVRDSMLDGVAVKEGAYIGVTGGKVEIFGAALERVLLDTVRRIAGDDGEVVTLYYGESLSSDEAKRLAEAVRASFPALEVELYLGGQPNYHFIISVE